MSPQKHTLRLSPGHIVIPHHISLCCSLYSTQTFNSVGKVPYYSYQSLEKRNSWEGLHRQHHSFQIIKLYNHFHQSPKIWSETHKKEILISLRKSIWIWKPISISLVPCMWISPRYLALIPTYLWNCVKVLFIAIKLSNSRVDFCLIIFSCCARYLKNCK